MSLLQFQRMHFTRRKVLWVCTGVILATCILLCSEFYFHQESYLLEPRLNPTGMRDSKYTGTGRDFVLPIQPDDDGEIHYRQYKTTLMQPRGTVYFLHGNRGDMNRCEWEIDLFLDVGYDVWTMDYRGFGDSRGTISESVLKQDAKRVYDQITPRDSEHRIIVWGRSFGSGIAAYVASVVEKKPTLLVLETPYWSLVDTVRQRYPIIPGALFRYELPTHQFLMSVSCPIHLIHGTQDKKIPPNSSDRLLACCKAKSIPVQGHSIMCGEHNLRDDETMADFEQIAKTILK